MMFNLYFRGFAMLFIIPCLSYESYMYFVTQESNELLLLICARSEQ